MTDFPTWAQAADYETDAVEAVEKMRIAITADSPGVVVDHIDAALRALHLLRQGAVSENHARLTALLTRAEPRPSC